MSRKESFTLRTTLSLVICLLIVCSAPYAQTPKGSTISASEAENHVGENATVCGKVASTRYAIRSRGRPTFLNLDKPYPDHIFIALIWEEHRFKFDRPEVTFRDKEICVAGKINSYRSVPRIIVSDPEQIRLK